MFKLHSKGALNVDVKAKEFFWVIPVIYVTDQSKKNYTFKLKILFCVSLSWLCVYAGHIKKDSFSLKLYFHNPNFFKFAPYTLVNEALPVFLVKICMSVDGYLWHRWPVCWIIKNILIHLCPNLHGLLWQRTQHSLAHEIRPWFKAPCSKCSLQVWVGKGSRYTTATQVHCI